MTAPGDFVVEGFPPIMLPAQNQLDQGQIWAIIAYLQSAGGEVTVTADDIGAAAAAAPMDGGGGTGGGFSDSTDPMELLTNNACLTCHGIDGTDPGIAPTFDGMGARISESQIRAGILDPNAVLAEGYENSGGMMPATFGRVFSAEQMEILVQFLAGRQ